MLLSLTKGDIKAAFRYNAAVFCLLPLFIALIAYWVTGYLFHKEKTARSDRVERFVYLGLAGALVLWGIVRNLTGL